MGQTSNREYQPNCDRRLGCDPKKRSLINGRWCARKAIPYHWQRKPQDSQHYPDRHAENDRTLLFSKLVQAPLSQIATAPFRRPFEIDELSQGGFSVADECEYLPLAVHFDPAQGRFVRCSTSHQRVNRHHAAPSVSMICATTRRSDLCVFKLHPDRGLVVPAKVCLAAAESRAESRNTQ